MDREEYVERVLSLVERIPPGRVTTYGALAEAVGVGGARQHHLGEGTPFRPSGKVDMRQAMWWPDALSAEPGPLLP